MDKPSAAATKPPNLSRHWSTIFLLLLPFACAFWLILFCFRPSDFTTISYVKTHLLSFGRHSPPPPPPSPSPPPDPDPCSGKYIYVHDIPSKFNSDMLRHCGTLNPWTNMCRFTSNAGLGPHLLDTEDRKVFHGRGWHATNQFAVDVIFHERMKRYRCLTNDSSAASAVFVPFYAGLDVGRYLWGYNTSVRDAAALDLVKWLRSRREWAAMGGRDHFLVGGRVIWDFERPSDDDSAWGNKLLLLPEAKNMTILVIEANPWKYTGGGGGGNDFGIPYPTYFHPSNSTQVLSWQKRVRKAERRWLFSFAGAPRPNQSESIRRQIIDQCRNSHQCNLLDCDRENAGRCHSPANVMKLFLSSTFCLQPQGDSFTRRSAFDAMVAGCIPVFFHPGSAYVQYRWHLPRNHSSYSVFIPEEDVRKGKVGIEDVLVGIKKETAKEMREVVVGMIPRLLYADPRAPPPDLRDAFDIAVDEVLKRVGKMRREMTGPSLNGSEKEEHGLHPWMG